MIEILIITWKFVNNIYFIYFIIWEFININKYLIHFLMNNKLDWWNYLSSKYYMWDDD